MCWIALSSGVFDTLVCSDGRVHKAAGVGVWESSGGGNEQTADHWVYKSSHLSAHPHGTNVSEITACCHIAARRMHYTIENMPNKQYNTMFSTTLDKMLLVTVVTVWKWLFWTCTAKYHEAVDWWLSDVVFPAVNSGAKILSENITL